MLCRICTSFASGRSIAVQRETGYEVHEKQGRLRDRRRSSALWSWFTKAPCGGVRLKRREADGELAPIDIPTEISVLPADALGSDTVPDGAEAEEEVGFEAGKPVNVRPLRARWEPTKEVKHVHESSGHAQVCPWCRACPEGAGRDIAHVRVERLDERAILVQVADYCFMGESDDGEANSRCTPIFTNRSHQYNGEGRTAFELRLGTLYQRALPRFGEKVAAMVLGKKKINNGYRKFEASSFAWFRGLT